MQFSIQFLLKGIRREFLTHWRSLVHLAGVLVFLSTVSYMAFFFLVEKTSWNWLFFYWLIFLLLALQLAGASYVRGNQDQKIYWYSVIHPFQLFIIKWVYQSFILSICAFLLFFLFWILAPLADLFVYHWILLIPVAATAVSLIFTLTSIISTSTEQHSMIILVISLPLIIPVMGILMTMGQKAMTNPTMSWYGQYLILFAILFLSLALSLFLIPMIWRN